MKYYITLIFILLSLASNGQNFEQHSAWIDTQQVDGKKIFVSWFQNNSSNPVKVHYEARLKIRNKPEQTVKGSTLSLPSTPTLLSKAIFTLDEVSFEHLHLIVLDELNENLAHAIVQSSPLLRKRIKKIDKAAPIVNQPKMTNPAEVEFDGLVIDETRTKTARDFYELFYRNWITIGINTKGRNIFIKEKPGRVGIGAIVIVEVDDRQVTQLNLQPRNEVLESLAGQLVSALEKYLNDPNNNTVIGGDDLSGSGIY